MQSLTYLRSFRGSRTRPRAENGLKPVRFSWALDQVELVYTVGAFADQWGWVLSDSEDLGMDAQWYSSLDDAFIASLWDGPLPPGGEVR
jgi:hypothetical protein